MSRFLSLLGWVALMASTCTAWAETPAKKGVPIKAEPAKEVSPYKGAPVVLVDVVYILTHYEPLMTQVQDWRKEYDAAKQRHLDELKSTVQLERRLKDDLVIDSPDYQRIEKEVLNRQIEAAASWKSEDRRFLRQRAQIFADAYQRIRADVDAFMKEHGIVLALNFDGDPFPGTPLTIAQLSRQLGGAPGGQLSFSTGWDCIPTVVESELDAETDAQEAQPRTSPQRVEYGLRNGVLGVQGSHDVTPFILSRLQKKAEAEKMKAAKDKTAAVPKKDGDKKSEAKKDDAKKDADAEPIPFSDPPWQF